MNEHKAMLTSQTGLSVTRQCQLLAVPRSSAYARAQPVSSVDLAFMRLLDELYLKWPFYGSRRLCAALQQGGHRVNRKRVRRMRQMGDASDLSEAPDQSSWQGTQDQPLSTERASDHVSQPGLGE